MSGSNHEFLGRVTFLLLNLCTPFRLVCTLVITFEYPLSDFLASGCCAIIVKGRRVPYGNDLQISAFCDVRITILMLLVIMCIIVFKYVRIQYIQSTAY